MRKVSADLWVGLAFLVFAILTLAVWIPADIDSGIIEKVRRREKMGDALFPTAIAVAMLLVALAHLVVTLMGKSERSETVPNPAFLLAFLGITFIALLLMRYGGPASVAILGETSSYRELRDTVPYKYVGFVVGGLWLVTGLIALVRGRLQWRGLAVGLVAVIGLILLYDVPFEDLLLPPNGDV